MGISIAMLVYQRVKHVQHLLVGAFNPLETIWVKLASSSPQTFGVGENTQKYLKPHHLDLDLPWHPSPTTTSQPHPSFELEKNFVPPPWLDLRLQGVLDKTFQLFHTQRRHPIRWSVVHASGLGWPVGLVENWIGLVWKKGGRKTEKDGAVSLLVPSWWLVPQPLWNICMSKWVNILPQVSGWK